MAKVAINGLGRIGRATLKIVLDTDDLELVAANDLIPPDNLAYLLQYDTVYGRYEHDVQADGDHLVIDGQSYRVYSEKDPAQLPWGELGIDIVFECTGRFTRREELEKHLQAGARTVILSAPVKSDEDEEVVTVVHGVNAPDGDVRMVSCASCTTNAITPVVEIMGRRIGIRKAIMTTVHAYTSSQNIVDGPSKDMRRGRAGAANLVPTSTGAAIATTKVLTQYAGRFDGTAIRAPLAIGSVADITFVAERPTTVEEINEIFRQEAISDRYRDVVSAVEAPLVSSDIVGDPHAAIIDLGMTQVVDGDLVKVMSWYDNEWGFTAQMVREALEIVHQTEPMRA
jgi:glyceraldehyde 3-phosphate dehydrogenase